MNILKKVAIYCLLFLLTSFAFIAASIPISILEAPRDLVRPSNQTSFIIDDINIVDVITGNVKQHQTVFLEGGRISKIMSSAEREIGKKERKHAATVIDGSSKYLVPGLIDMHVHVHDRKYLLAYLSKGITTVRNMRGLPMHLRWREEIKNGEWLGSRLITSSPVLAGEKYSHLLQEVVTSPERARNLVNDYAMQGFDFIKVYSHLDKNTYLAIREEARKLNIPVAKHGPETADNLPVSSLIGLQSLEHVENIYQGVLFYEDDDEAFERWLSEFKKTEDIPIVPTLANFEHLTMLSNEKHEYVAGLELEILNPLYKFINGNFEVARWLNASQEQADYNQRTFELLIKLTKRLHSSGVQLLVGSDSGVLYMAPGESTHREIYLMNQAGMPSIDIIQAATIRAAEVLGKASELGSVDVGKIADLIIVSDNPLSNIQSLAAPEYVFSRGEKLDETLLLQVKSSLLRPSNWYISLGRLLEDLFIRFIG